MARYQFLPLVGLLASTVAATSPPNATKNTFLPSSPTNGSTTVDFTSSEFNFDAPRVRNNNGSAWDWWYFDAVAPDSAASVTAIFYNSFEASDSSATNLTSVDLSFTLPNGTMLDPITVYSAGATVTQPHGQEGASGIWHGTGFGFESSDDMRTYTLTLDSAALGIHGSIVLEALAPPHYPCSAATATTTPQDTQIVPHMGWANALPDARGTVNLTLPGGTAIAFTNGTGYHDKNWADRSVGAVATAWNWGHAHIGAWSVVWFDALGLDGAKAVAGYVAKNGVVVAAGCAAGSVVVRPVGNGSASSWPPVAGERVPDRLWMWFDAGEEGAVEVETENEVVVAEKGFYRRWSGEVRGRGVGEREWVGGRGVWEMITLRGFAGEGN